MVLIKFETNNEAFAEENGPLEVARLLREIADKVENFGTGGRVKDINGNIVGQWECDVGDVVGTED